MKVKFNQKKYIYPLFVFPFIFLMFYVYNSLGLNTKKEKSVVAEGLQGRLSDPSQQVVESNLKDKLTTYRENYRNAEGYTAIQSLSYEKQEADTFEDLYSIQEKRRLDSLEAALKSQLYTTDIDKVPENHYKPEPLSESDQALLDLINSANQQNIDPSPDDAPSPPSEEDPMERMRQQMALIDSFQNASNPEFIEEQKRIAIQEALEKQRLEFLERKSQVEAANNVSSEFNTLKPTKDKSFIKAIIDEDITGYAGSRIRIRLLEDITVSDQLIEKGTCLYALINGFSAQRVSLNISTIMLNGNIYQINLDVYDIDGLKGLYVPESAFRDFTKDLGTQTLQGVNVSTGDGANDLLMSGVGSMFQSTSQAIAKAIRKNKAKIKNSTHIFLIDSQELNNQYK
ncbi:conjugative transposon protein TraM [uncultured Draconibacterium sp.]|uniref:conjugative transposon protein TraM n=1 Tax=uncultured Draconibacterium sp. TaxID=1573823 RepID=UPI0029C8E369|nr:conjugative transposon protein TraM [uncultured Draconibacterium sp.]